MKKENQSSMFQEERRRQILEILEKEERVMTKDLYEKFNTTSVTIRKDLAVLEERGKLKRTHGGAIKSKELFQGLAFSEKEKMFLNEKTKIVKCAAQFIKSGDTIILDSGSTTSLLINEIKEIGGVTVITNAVNIAYGLAKSNNEVILTGGQLKKNSLTLMGPLANSVIKKISAGRLFFGVDGIDLDAGLTTPNITEANTTRAMMSIVGEKILLIDSSKFGRRSLAVIGQVNEVDKIITTKPLHEDEIKQFEELGVEVIIV